MNKDERREYNRQYWLKNKDRLLARRRKRVLEIQAYMKEYRNKNREKLIWQGKNWLAKNPGKKAEYDQAYRAKNPEKVAEKALRDVYARRRRIRSAFVERVEAKTVLRNSNGRCGLCGRPIGKGKKFHIDHIVPLSRGGEHSYANTQAAHISCHRQKSAQEHRDSQRRT